MIRSVDNFLSDRECEDVVRYCIHANYYWGERDESYHEPTGMVHDIYAPDITTIEESSQWFYDLFVDKTQDMVIRRPDLKVSRLGINCFAPGENPNFHQDNYDDDSLTCLYYVPLQSWDYNDGGETQFIKDEQIVGILPIPNRMVYFDSKIWHKATSFKNKWRFTVALKYEPRQKGDS